MQVAEASVIDGQLSFQVQCWAQEQLQVCSDLMMCLDCNAYCTLPGQAHKVDKLGKVVGACSHCAEQSTTDSISHKERPATERPPGEH